MHETPQEYYYKVYAIGKNGILSDAAIARHIVNGINDYNLKRKVSNEYVYCNQLLNDIISYYNYNQIKTPSTNNNNKMKSNINKATVKVAQAKKDNGVFVNKINCYDCSNYDHFSSKCPEPQKKRRCEICLRISYKTAECRTKQDNPVNVKKIQNT